MSSWLFAGAGWSRLRYPDRSRDPVNAKDVSEENRHLNHYVPETFPHQWLPEKLELKTWEQIEPWYQKLMDQPIDSAADLERWVVAAGELNAAVGRGGGRALRRDDLPDRRPRARGRLPGLRPRHRAQAQADPERDPRAGTSTRRFDRSCRATAISSSTAPWRTAAPCSARRTSPARPSWPSWSSSIRRSSGR